MISPHNLDWFEHHGGQSSPPWCHFSCSTREIGEDAQYCLWYHRCLQQTPLTLPRSSEDYPTSPFVSMNCSIQRTANSIHALEEENFFENPENSVTEASPIGVTPSPVRDSPRLHYSNSPMDLMLTDVYLSETGRQFPNFETGHEIQPSSDDLGTPYTLEYFERQFPFAQASTLLQPHRAPSIFENEYDTDQSDHSRRLDSELAAPESSLKMLTETNQADLESVFNSTTGEQHKVATKKGRRKTTLKESLHRKLIRGLGGQCKSCKRRKRRCDRSHLVSESPYSSRQSEASNSSSPDFALAMLNLGPEGPPT